MEFLEATVPVFYGTLHLHADGTYRLEPPFRSHDLPWPRRVRVKVPATAQGGGAGALGSYDVDLYADGTYSLESVS